MTTTSAGKRDGTRGRNGERGSAMMLVPAAVLVVVILGAIAVDSAIVFMAERDLANRAAAVANDAAAHAVSDDAFYGEGDVELDAEAVDRYVDAVFSAGRRPAGYEQWSASARAAGRQVTVTARAEVRYVFAAAIPGVRDTAKVEATAVATARGG